MIPVVSAGGVVVIGGVTWIFIKLNPFSILRTNAGGFRRIDV
jgi:hypothetical protein